MLTRPIGTLDRAIGVAPAGAWWRVAFAMFAVGWSANHFVPLLALYRRTLALDDASLTAIFATYALGLTPGFLLGGPAGDRFGRRPPVLAGTALSLVASGVLATASGGPLGLYVGRFLTGLAAGVVFAVGTAWLKELSSGETLGTGPRRAAVTLSAGFAVGPLAAAALAQWAPWPTLVPYLAPIALAGCALALLPAVPETVTPERRARRSLNPWTRAARDPRFLRRVVPMAPWVFGSATIGFVALPAAIAPRVGEWGILFAGGITALNIGAGIAVQPLARRLGDRAAVLGLGSVVAGCAIGAAAIGGASPAGLALAAGVLGLGYGTCLVAGLAAVERIAPPPELGRLVAIYYALTYSGLVVPYLLAALAPSVSYTGALLAAAAAAGGCLLVVRSGTADSPRLAPSHLAETPRSR